MKPRDDVVKVCYLKNKGFIVHFFTANHHISEQRAFIPPLSGIVLFHFSFLFCRVHAGSWTVRIVSVHFTLQSFTPPVCGEGKPAISTFDRALFYQVLWSKLFSRVYIFSFHWFDLSVQMSWGAALPAFLISKQYIVKTHGRGPSSPRPPGSFYSLSSEACSDIKWYIMWSRSLFR